VNQTDAYLDTIDFVGGRIQIQGVSVCPLLTTLAKWLQMLPRSIAKCHWFYVKVASCKAIQQQHVIQPSLSATHATVCSCFQKCKTSSTLY